MQQQLHALQDVASEQVLVARLIHALYADDPTTHFALLSIAREQLLLGGPRRIRHTLPALGWATLRLIHRVAAAAGSKVAAATADATADDDEASTSAAGAGAAAAAAPVTAASLLQWLLATCLSLADAPEPLLALRWGRFLGLPFDSELCLLHLVRQHREPLDVAWFSRAAYASRSP